MNWRLKAAIQNLVDKLPTALSYTIYYKIQRYFGGFKDYNPTKQLRESVLILKDIKRTQYDFTGKTFLEIGTGHTVTVPIGLWLAGASRIITVDLNPYLKEELVVESIQHICQNRNEIRQLFNDVTSKAAFDDRLEFLCDKKDKCPSLFESMNIQYLTPVNLECLPIVDHSVDFLFSIHVLEHIPPKVINSLLCEAKRVLAIGGLLVHRITLSDHFAHSDQSISGINFLRFSEKDWLKLAGNKFMYHNRLRALEYEKLFDDQGVAVLNKETRLDERALELLRGNFPLDRRFSRYRAEELAMSALNIVGAFSTDSG